MIKVEIIKNVDVDFENKETEKICETYLKLDSINADKILSGKRGELTLVFCDDMEIRKFNKDTRGIDKATDVLSFVYHEKGYDREGNFNHIILGDILISIDTAKTQAEEKGHSLTKEIEILFTHGLLHIFGYDHNDDIEEAQMDSLAEKISGKLT